MDDVGHACAASHAPSSASGPGWRPTTDAPHVSSKRSGAISRHVPQSMQRVSTNQSPGTFSSLRRSTLAIGSMLRAAVPSAVVLLHEILTFAATRTPDATALVVGDATWTFAELEDRVARLAGVLAANATPGDRVAVVADNCAAWVECYYGVPRAGMVLTPINQRL